MFAWGIVLGAVLAVVGFVLGAMAYEAKESKELSQSGGYRRLLFVGTGRCGTKWIAGTFCKLGLPCTHEGIFNASRSNAFRTDWLAETSWLAPAYQIPKDTYVVHVTREPEAYVLSRMRQRDFTPEKLAEGTQHHIAWAASHLPEIGKGRTDFELAALHWYYWNRFIENTVEVDERIRAEDISEKDFRRWADTIGYVYELDPMTDHQRDLNDRNVRTRGRRRGLPWHPKPRDWRNLGDILRGLNKMAKRYGYEGISW